ncbi:SERTA domain-containing protein 3, partial [Marasmius crinis-equi]
MPNRPTFIGQRAEFLREKGPDYAKARSEGTHKDIVAVIQHQFLRRWPIGSENVELTEEQLKAIDDDAVLPERVNPKDKKDSYKSEVEYKKAEEEWVQYNKDLTTRKRQIEDRLKNDYNKEHHPAMKKGDNHPFTPLLDQLSYGKNASGKPCKQSAEQAWADANKVQFEATREKRKKTQPKKMNDAVFYNKVLREEFGKLTEQEQKDWEERSKTEQEERLKKWKEQRHAKPSEKPEDRQACIDRLNEFCGPILDGIAERTGWSCSLLLGGPEPRDGGRLNMLALHAGPPTTGPVKMQFGRAEIGAWKGQFFPVYSRYLKKVYSKLIGSAMEECRARALPSDYADKEAEEDREDDEEMLRWRDPEDIAEKDGSAGNEGDEKQGGAKNGETSKAKDKGAEKEKGREKGAEKGKERGEKKGVKHRRGKTASKTKG